MIKMERPPSHQSLIRLSYHGPDYYRFETRNMAKIYIESTNPSVIEADMSRKLANMLELEEHYVIRHSYFTSRVTAWHRQQLITWLLEVCEEEGADLVTSSFGLAVNMFDRFMAREARRVEVGHLQLLGCVCLFIACKLSSGRVLSAEKLADYTNNSIRVCDILEWECLVLSTLQWDVASVQANDYIDLFVDRLSLDEAVIKRTRVYTALCLTEFKFAFYPASMLAAACLLVSKPTARPQLTDILGLDLECLLGLTELVSGLVSAVGQPDSSSSSSNSQAVEFEDDYDFLLDLEPQHNISPPISSHSDKNRTSKKSKRKSTRMPNQYCSYYILTPPQPSCLPLPTF